MKKTSILLATLLLTVTNVFAQNELNRINEDGNITSDKQKNGADSLGTDKEIPKGMKVWTVDARFGDRNAASPDTLSHLFMNTTFTMGRYGEYNSLGNLGAPRIARVFIHRPTDGSQFIFTQPYSFFLVPVERFLFTNTLSPITNLSYYSCGDKTDGEDRFKANFGVNAGKRIGAGFQFDYDYGRGYYQNQSTALFNYTMYASYIGDRYLAHLLFSTNHQKITENGGITNDNYITHPETFNESFSTSEIPTVLQKNWNRNDNQHLFFSHRYNIGFHRKVPMTKEEIEARKFAIAAKKDQQERERRKGGGKDNEGSSNKERQEEKSFAGRPDNAKIMGAEPAKGTAGGERIAVNGKAAADSLLAMQRKEKEDTAWLKNEYVPVTSFIHTLKFDNYRRIYEAHQTPTNYYANSYYNAGRLKGDSIYDETRHYVLKNTVALALLEGFNKWAKSGLKAFLTSELRHSMLPDTQARAQSYNEHNISIGGQLSKTQGKTFHYGVTAETWLVGKDAGQLKIDGTTDLNFRLFGDTVTLAASAFFYRLNPTFYYRHYHSRHFWWDNDALSKIIHTRLQGILHYKKTRTTLRFAVDELKNYTYLAQSYTINSNFTRTANTVTVEQSGAPINLLTAELNQDVTLGPIHWESIVTWQKSSKEAVLPVPTLNVYTNLYLRFKIARVLKCDLGADLRYFTSYYAPDYSPALGQFTVQASNSLTKIGNYPIVNVYANFQLKQARFFLMASHVNAGSGRKNYFLTPHYPLNDRVIYFGLSWNFFN